MPVPATRAVAWVAGEALSSFVRFEADAPNAFIIPAGLQGFRLVFVGAPVLANGMPDLSNAADIWDTVGARIGLRIPATIPAAGARVAFWLEGLRNQGMLALRSVDSAETDVVQTQPRQGAWLMGRNKV